MDFLHEHKGTFDTALADFAGFKGFPEQILESAIEAAVIIDNQKRIVYVSGGYQKRQVSSLTKSGGGTCLF